MTGIVAIVATASFAVAGGMSHTRTLLAAGRTVPVAIATCFSAAAAVAFGATWLPTSLGFLALRAALGAGCLAMFVAMTLTLSGHATSRQARRVAGAFMSRRALAAE